MTAEVINMLCKEYSISREKAEKLLWTPSKLRDALFDELDRMRAGKTTATNEIARASKQTLTWHAAMRYLFNNLPNVEGDLGKDDWPDEVAEMVRMIHEGRGIETAELEELVAQLSQLLQAVQSIEEERNSSQQP